MTIEELVKKYWDEADFMDRGYFIGALTEQAESFKGELAAYDGTVRELQKTVEDMRASQSVPVVGEPVAWMLLRDSDKTFPRVFTSEQAADQLVAWNNVAPAIVKHGLYMQKLKSASDVDREMDYRTRLAQAEHELDALRKDAARYRWLRDSPESPIINIGYATDKMVDAAIAQGKGE